MESALTWLVRFGHVLAAAVWVGGWATLAFVLVPRLEREPGAALAGLTLASIRMLTYVGTATLVLGILLISRTRGFVSLLRLGEWGLILVCGLVLAIALLGLGDSGLRPAVRRLTDGAPGRRARRLALSGFGLTVAAVALMTRALYAGS